MCPTILNEYINFCNIRKNALATNNLDISACNFIHPTCLLPLILFKKEHNDMRYVPPPSQVANYMSIIENRHHQQSSSYLPIHRLSFNRSETDDDIDQLCDHHNNGIEYGDESAFRFMITELIDNIYQHSQFNFAAFMAQRYDTKGFVEITIMDDGMSIPCSFEKHGIDYKNDCDAITAAINGKSTKIDGNRGYGLPDTTNLYVNGCGAEFFLVSRNGALYKNRDDENLYNTEGLYILNGTLITVRIPCPTNKVQIYNYIS
ncbi:MAG TPA: hypothetical protein C5S51_01710 [Methanosarcinaceae archaeon]|nr:hypothetical protein [Methanosarcinaceae archaeon]